MARLTSPEAEKMLDVEIPVLDKGFVRLVDYMGSDARIVQSARVSYGEGTTTVSRDKILIDYLMRHLHTSPFEQVIITVHAKLPIFVARQWIRHRTARLNELSGRYSEMVDEFYIPTPDRIRKQDSVNIQGSSDEEVPAELKQKVISLISSDSGDAFANYRSMLDDGVSRELARINLPLNLYTEWYWQIDLHNLFHFLKLRMDSHAQWEIQQYANALGKIAQAVAPWAYESFEEHRLYGANFSRSEIEALKAMITGGQCPLKGRIRGEFFTKMGMTDEQDQD
jgi:thymidylate synthase (FAD)